MIQISIQSNKIIFENSSKLRFKFLLKLGGSSGFGKALAERLVSHGCRVVLGDISAKQGAEVESLLNSKNPNSCLFVKCDVTKRQEYINLFEAAVKKFGAIDIVVNNAGISEPSSFYDNPDDLWVKVVDVNMTAMILGCRLGVAYFTASKRPGVIVNTSSMSAFVPLSPQPVYSATKVAIVHFTKSLGFLDGESNIRVNAICPSFARTALIKNIEGIDELPEEVFVTVDAVVDAFMLAITDDSLAGDIVTVTSNKGVAVDGRDEEAKL